MTAINSSDAASRAPDLDLADNLAPATPPSPPETLPPLPDSGSGSPPWLELARVSLESLLANRMRSLLTMLGIIIGVASVVTLLSWSIRGSRMHPSISQSQLVVRGRASLGPGTVPLRSKLTTLWCTEHSSERRATIGV